MNLARWLRSHQRSLLLLFLALALGGLASLRKLPAGIFPPTTYPRILVSVDAGQRSVDRMILEVTRPIEEAVQGVPGLRHVRSTSSRGSCDISLDFAWGTDMIAATLQVESAITKQLPDLPAGLRFDVRRMDPTVFPVIGLSLTSKNRSLISLRDIALYDLQPVLSTIEGVARISVLGGETQEFQVLVDPAVLDSVGLTLDDVVKKVSAANVVGAVGRLEEDEKLYLLLSDTQFHSADELAQVVVKTTPQGVVRLEDLASIESTAAPQWTRVVANGRDSVLLNVYQQRGGDTVNIARAIHEHVSEFKKRAPPDLEINVWYDQSSLIQMAAGSLRDAIAIGILLAALILWLFLRNGRITLIALLSVPFALAITLIVLRAFDQSLNIMTLGGMAAAVGLVIDDGIVMVEHIIRRMREGGEQHRSVVEAAQEMGAPLVGSSLATVIIFVPLAYLTGITGAFFRALALTMASALTVSFFLAFLAVPALAEFLLRKADARSEDVGPFFGRILSRYESLLRGLIAHPRRAAIAVGLVLLLGAVAYRQTGSGFLPQMDEGGFVLDYVAPPGTSLSETDRRLRQVESILAQTPEVADYSRRTGLALGGGITEANEGDYFIRLKGMPRAPIEEVMGRIRNRVEREVPGLQIELAQLMGDLIGDLTAVPQPIEVKLFGPDPEQLRSLAESVAPVIRTIPGVVDVKSGVVLAGDAVDIAVDRVLASGLGLDPEEVTQLATIALEGDVATQVQRKEKMVGIRVWTRPGVRASLDSIENLRLRTPSGVTIRLGRVASFKRLIGQPQITRENLKTMVAVTGRIAGRDLGSVMQDVQRTVAKLSLPKSVYVEYGGLYREQRKSFHGLVLVMAAAAILVFVLLLYLYEQFAAPLAILMIAGLGAAGVFLGLWLTGSELDISAMMGLTMIVGITSEAAIFFMTQWSECREQLPFDEALVTAGRLRFRPILMTALAAIGALLPLAMGLGEGSAMLKPLAIGIIAGLVVTVPGVLLLLPLVFRALSGQAGRSSSR